MSIGCVTFPIPFEHKADIGKVYCKVFLSWGSLGRGTEWAKQVLKEKPNLVTMGTSSLSLINS